MGRSWPRPPRRRLFWRVYLHGVFLLLAVAVAVGVIGWALGRGRWREPMDLRREVAAAGPALLADPAALQALVYKAGERFNAHVTVYTAEGALLSTNVDPPVPRISPEVLGRLGDEPLQVGRPHWQLVIPLRVEGALRAYAVAEWRGPGARQLLRGAAMVGAVLLALALASIPLVRTIVSPLERLTRAAQALGQGDLSTRSGLRRGGEVGELARAFDEMAERLERQVKRERELLANVSHELRTPLSRIRVALELAAEGDGQEAQKYLRELGTDLAELETLVEDVLTTARLDAQEKAGEGFPLHRQAVSAAELVGAAAQRFRDRFPDRPLKVLLSEGLPGLDADPMLLRRALDNLLDNSRKYSEDGSEVELRAQPEAGGLRIEIADHGIGMGAEDLRNLFTPFFRSDQSRARGTGGVGLGLTLARRIVDAHGGTLSVWSEPGRGSTFSVRLPGAIRQAAPNGGRG